MLEKTLAEIQAAGAYWKSYDTYHEFSGRATTYRTRDTATMGDQYTLVTRREDTVYAPHP